MTEEEPDLHSDYHMKLCTCEQSHSNTNLYHSHAYGYTHKHSSDRFNIQANCPRRKHEQYFMEITFRMPVRPTNPKKK